MTYFIIAAHIALALVSVYFIFKMKFQPILYALAILLNIVMIAGVVMSVWHMPVGSEMMKVGMAGFVLGGVLFIWKGLKNNTGGILKYHLILGVIILVQLALVQFGPEKFLRLEMLLNYPLVGVAGTIILKEDYVHEGEKNLLIVYAFSGLIFIVNDVLQLMI